MKPLNSFRVLDLTNVLAGMVIGFGVPVTCRLDTAEEVSVYVAGVVLQRFAQDFLAGNASAKGSEI